MQDRFHPQSSWNQSPKDEVIINKKDSKQKKYPKDSGEYVDFEEIK
jgi:hypothetical protein